MAESILSSLCRTCLKSINSEENSVSILDHGLYESVQECLSVYIGPNDCLSKRICADCQYFIVNFHKFRAFCLETETVLRKLLTSRCSVDELKLNIDLLLIKKNTQWKKLTGNDNDLTEHINEFVKVETENYDAKNWTNNNDDVELLDDATSVYEPLARGKRKRSSQKIRVRKSKRSQQRNQRKNVETDESYADVNDDVDLLTRQLDLGTEIQNGFDSNLTQVKTDLCTICGTNQPNLVRHMRRKHNQTSRRDELVKCEYCDEMYSSRNMSKHMRTAHKGMPRTSNTHELFKCDYCEETFNQRKLLTIHKHHKHRKNKMCHYCGELYSNPDHFLKHENNSTGNDVIKKEAGDPSDTSRRHICEICSKVLKTKYRLRAHIKQVHETPIVTCNYCNIQVKKNCFQIHLTNLHSQLAPKHECNVCGRKFKQKWNLKSHMGLHTDERPLKCQFCDQCFRHSKTLKHHEMRHTGEKPHACTVCDKRFIQRIALKVHMRTHSGQRDYFCTMCPKTFTQSSALNTHLKSHGSVV